MNFNRSKPEETVLWRRMFTFRILPVTFILLDRLKDILTLTHHHRYQTRTLFSLNSLFLFFSQILLDAHTFSICGNQDRILEIRNYFTTDVSNDLCFCLMWMRVVVQLSKFINSERFASDPNWQSFKVVLFKHLGEKLAKSIGQNKIFLLR